MKLMNLYRNLFSGLFALQVILAIAIYYSGLGSFLYSVPLISETVENIRLKANIAAVWSEFSPHQRVWGYIDQHSILPGETLNLMLSSRPGGSAATGKVIVSRLTGAKEGLKRVWAWESDVSTISAQQILNTSASLGASWDVNYVIDGTSGWRSGLYSVDFVDASGTVDEDVAYFVVKSREKTGDILFKLGSNTYEAYNRWGGHSLYRSSLFGHADAMVTFDRPTAPAFNDYDAYFIQWAEQYCEKNGRSISYITDFDLHSDPSIADGYKVLVTGTHDEYWTNEMFSAVEDRIFKKGKNVVFLGANTAYWAVRYADVNQVPGTPAMGRQLIGYKDEEDPALSRFADPSKAMPYQTNMFRWKNRRPETMLAGVAYQSYFEPGDESLVFDYGVSDTTASPLFDGTGLKTGDSIKGIVGYEWDNRDPQGDGKRLWDPSLSTNANLPLDKIHVLFSGSPIDVDGKKGTAESVYWTSDAGAKVFASGSIRWAWGLSKPGFEDERFQKFNKNLFDLMLANPSVN